jgi:UPF0716 protein FxsA
MAKWLLLAVLALPFAELAAFVAVAATIGFGLALLLLVATSVAGGLVLRHAGGMHIARVRSALGTGSFTALQTDNTGALVLLAGILLFIPGFITDAIGVLLLLAPLGAALRRGPPPRRADGVLDLEPEQWHRVPEQSLPHRDEDGGRQR